MSRERSNSKAEYTRLDRSGTVTRLERSGTLMSHQSSSSANAGGIGAGATYNVLHTSAIDEDEELHEHYDDDDDQEADTHRKHLSVKREVLESFDFNENESLSWRKHQYRRYFQGKGVFWTANRTTTFLKWVLVILTGLLIAFTGAFAIILTEALVAWKYENIYRLMDMGNHGAAFFAYHCLSVFLILFAGTLCYYYPAAAGSGIPEIKVYLNGVNLNTVVKMPILGAKVVGMCFSVAAGLPLGMEGPMIHAGSIIGAAVSQGNTYSIGFDNSWNHFQDFRNDYTKRDFVTFGAAAGVAAAFRAPIGGILFALEEGASFWSTSLTFAAFMCAVITHLAIGVIFSAESMSHAGIVAFGLFENLHDRRTNFFVYEIPIFIVIGCIGGVLGAFFNHINEKVSLYRKKNLNAFKWKRMIELVCITLLMAFLSFILSIMWQKCTPMPEINSHWTSQQIEMSEKLVEFQCKSGEYNELASIFVVSGNTAMRQLYHMRELQGEGLDSFTTGPLILFVVPYFFMAAITSGSLCPAGLFVPTLLTGAAIGRLIGHWLNILAPGYVADSGTYALIGSAAILGGMARMTIAGCIIVLEACGNITYLLPLMVTFASARYVGNYFNESMYDMQIHLKDMPFLEGSLHSLGILNYHPISEIMAKPVLCIMEVEKVRRVMDLLTNTKHNGFPVVNKDGKLRGIILRKTLCGLLKNKAYSKPSKDAKTADGGIVLQQATNIAYDTLERQYPNFPDVNAIKMKNEKDLSYWLDVRAYMDPSAPMVNEDTSIRRCYNYFRTLGMRHVVIVNGEMQVRGIITRSDMNEHHLKHYWEHEGEHLQKDLHMDSLPLAVVYETLDDRSRSGTMTSADESILLDYSTNDMDAEIINVTISEAVSDSPSISLRKKIVL